MLLALLPGKINGNKLSSLAYFNMEEKKLKEAIKFYEKGKITLWKGARLCDISLWKMMEIMKERKIPAQYGEKELREDLLALKVE